MSSVTNASVGSRDLFDERLGIRNPNRVNAERSQTHHAEIGVAHHDGVGSAPLEIGELLCVNEINFRFER